MGGPRGAWLAIAIAAVALACEKPDPARDGFLLVDEEARAAGISVEVSGQAHEGVAPVPVPEGAEARVVRPSGTEPVEVPPGELVRVRGEDGWLERTDAPRDSILVSGDEAAVGAMAEMIGARVSRGPDGRYLVEGPDAFVLAALIGAQPGVTGIGAPVSRRAEEADVLDVGFELTAPPRDDARDEDLEAADLPTPDAAALVGLYHHGDVGLLLDALGGYALMYRGEVVRRGVFRVRPGGVDFVPDDGGEVATMDLSGERLVDHVGIDFNP